MGNLSGFVKRLRDIMRNDAGINGDAQRIEQIAWLLFLKVYDAKEQDWEMDDSDYCSIIPAPCCWSNWAYDDKSGSVMTGDTLLNFVNNTLFPVLKGTDIKGEDGTVKIEGVRVTADTPIKKAIVQTAFADANNYMKDGVLLRQCINVIDDLDLSDYDEIHAFGEIYESILRELQSAGSAGEYYTPRAVTDFMARMIQPKIGERMADFACGTGGFLTSWLKEVESQVRTTDDRTAYSNSVYGIEKKQFPYMLCTTNMLLHDVDYPRVYHENSLMKNVRDYKDNEKVDFVLMNPPYGGHEQDAIQVNFPSQIRNSETANLFIIEILYRLNPNGRCGVILPDGFLQNEDARLIKLKEKLFKECKVHTIIRLPGSCFAPYTSIATNLLFFDKTGSTTETWFYRFDLPRDCNFSMKKNPITREKLVSIDEWWDNRIEIRDERHEDSVIESWKSRCVTIEEIKSSNYNLDFCGFPMEEKIIQTPEDALSFYISKREQLEKKLDMAEHISNSSTQETEAGGQQEV